VVDIKNEISFNYINKTHVPKKFGLGRDLAVEPQQCSRARGQNTTTTIWVIFKIPFKFPFKIQFRSWW
jgi:hypothetical protein